MKKLIAAAAFAATMALAPANAGTIDFSNDAVVNGERGLVSGSTIAIDGVNMRISATQGLDINQPFAAHPYLDGPFNGKDGGLGVCKALDGGTGLCAPRYDDNVTIGEAVKIEFLDFAGVSEMRDILGITFRDAGHNAINAANDGMLLISSNNGSMTALFSAFIAMAAGGDAFFKDVAWIEFIYDNKQFYVNALDVSEIPIPGALPLLLSGRAGLGFAGRRRKSKA